MAAEAGAESDRLALSCPLVEQKARGVEGPNPVASGCSSDCTLQCGLVLARWEAKYPCEKKGTQGLGLP